MPRPKGEPTIHVRVYKDDAAWLTDNAEANGVSVAEAFRRLRQRRGERPVLVDVAAVAPSTSEPTLHAPPGTGAGRAPAVGVSTDRDPSLARLCDCATPKLSKVVSNLCTGCRRRRS